MTAITKPRPTTITQPPQLRPIRLPDDLRNVADLVELCFDATLDADGRRFIRQMRQATSQKRAFPGTVGSFSTAKGYVWTEGGKIVGNINIIPVTIQNRRGYLIANVAVHPDYRQQGISRAMTEAALTKIRSSRVRKAVLQVDINNLHAQALYRSYEFIERARRTTWHSDGISKIKMPPSVIVRERHRTDWVLQRKWLDYFYNRHVRWNLPIDQKLYAPSIFGELTRAFHNHKVRQWSAEHHGQWIGSLIWQSSYNQADWLWVSAPPEKLELAVCALIPHARQDLLSQNLIKPGRVLAVNFPAGEFQNTFETIGFQHHKTLIWMQKELK